MNVLRVPLRVVPLSLLLLISACGEPEREPVRPPTTLMSEPKAGAAPAGSAAVPAAPPEAPPRVEGGTLPGAPENAAPPPPPPPGSVPRPPPNSTADLGEPGGDPPNAALPGIMNRSAHRGTTIRLPTAALLGDRTIPAGKYTVRVEDGPDGPTVVLARDGQTVVQELGARPPTPAHGSGNAAWLRVDRRDEPTYRIFAQRGRELYFLLLAIAP